MFMSAVVGLTLVVSAAQAAVTVSYNAAQPTKDVLTSFAADKGLQGIQWRKDLESGKRDVGQSFRVTNNAILDSFSYKVAGNVQPGASESSFTLKIYENPNSKSLGTVISTQTATYLSTAENPINPGWVTFDVENVNLKAGNYYTCMLSFDEADVDRQNQVFAEATGRYDGKCWMDEDKGPVVNARWIINFSVQGVITE